MPVTSRRELERQFAKVRETVRDDLRDRTLDGVVDLKALIDEHWYRANFGIDTGFSGSENRVYLGDQPQAPAGGPRQDFPHPGQTLGAALVILQPFDPFNPLPLGVANAVGADGQDPPYPYYLEYGTAHHPASLVYTQAAARASARKDGDS